MPHCLKDVRSFFGLASYYRRFVKGFATIAEPLTRLTRKMARFEWSEEAQLAFETLKKALVEATSLAFPVPQEPCVLDTCLRRCGRGCVVTKGRWHRKTDCIFLSNHERDPEELLYYASRTARSNLCVPAFQALLAGHQDHPADRPPQSEMASDI